MTPVAKFPQKPAILDRFFVVQLEANILLEYFASFAYINTVAEHSEIVQAMKDRLARLAKQIAEVRDELSDLEGVYQHIQDLETKIEQGNAEMFTLMSLLGKESANNALQPFAEHRGLLRYSRENRPAPWVFVAEYLRYAKKAKVGQVVGFLNQFGLSLKRQNVEAIVRGRPDVFKVTKHGRDKFLSLRKGHSELL